MNLYLVRHGLADWPNWDKPDDERPLTEEGRKKVKRVAKLLRKLGVKSPILSSPLPRASQTADILSEVLGEKVEIREELRPGFGKTELKELLGSYQLTSLMLVGHEPDFTQVTHRLTGAKTKLTKAGVVLVKLDPSKMTGELLWLLPAKISK